MKNILLLICIMFAPMSVMSDPYAEIYGSGYTDQLDGVDDVPVGIAAGYKNDFMRVAGRFAGGLGADITLHHSFGDFDFGIGAGVQDTAYRGDVSVAGQPVSARSTTFANTAFVDVSYKRVFIRAAYEEADWDLYASRNIGTAEVPITARGTDNVTDEFYRVDIGVRF